MYLEKEHNEFSLKIQNKNICLDFYIQGLCSKRVACHYSSSYSYISSHSFYRLIQFSRGLLDKYSESEKEDHIKNRKLKIKPIILKVKKEEPKENELKDLD